MFTSEQRRFMQARDRIQNCILAPIQELLDATGDAIKSAADAEKKFDVLQSIHLNMGEEFAARAALTQVWESLGVDNQTHCMVAIRALVQQAEKLP